MNVRSDRGIILAWVTIMVVIMTLLGAALLHLSGLEAVLVARDVNHLKALNLADAGLNRALWKLANDPTWTQGWTGESLGDGCYSVAIGALEEPNWYCITSTGTVGTTSKTVALEVEVISEGWPSVFSEYGIFWGNPSGSTKTLDLRENAVINGSIFAYGDIEIKPNATVTNGMVYSTGSASGAGEYTVGELPDPLPERLSLDTSHYDGLIAQAAQQESEDWHVAKNGSYSLDGQTRFVNGKAEVGTNAELHGPGTIVATDDIKIENNVKISGGVDLISGKKLTLSNNTAYKGSGNVIFAYEKIEIDNNTSGENSLLVFTPGELKLGNNASVFRGVLWGGTVCLKNNALVIGAIYANQAHHDEVKENFTLVHDPSVFDSTPPPAVPSESSSVNLHVGRWHEQ